MKSYSALAAAAPAVWRDPTGSGIRRWAIPVREGPYEIKNHYTGSRHGGATFAA
ncbi:MAG: hypothetical protein OXG64_02125 [Chloroflexi bacterium]|nr:hypothetical protein [Chloroflexota bacterium]